MSLYTVNSVQRGFIKSHTVNLSYIITENNGIHNLKIFNFFFKLSGLPEVILLAGTHHEGYWKQFSDWENSFRDGVWRG